MSDVPKIKLDGVDYPLVTLDDMTMREQREFEKIANAGVDKLENLQDEWRAGLVVAWMAVSIKREKPTTPISQIVDRLDELKPAELREAWEDLAGQSPPESNEQQPSSTATAAEGTPPADNSAGSSEPTQENENPNGSGSQPSAIAVLSGPPTSES